MGTADGAGAGARFRFPTGVAVDAAGNVFVADTNNHTIRRITPAGVVTTVAGQPGLAGNNNGPVATARFSRPQGVAVDGQGNIYVADTENSLVRKITPAGIVTTLAGQTDPYLYGPQSVGVDGAGNVYVADTNNQVIRRITPSGAITTVAGQLRVSGFANGTGDAARFYYPNGLCVDAGGTLYVADSGNDVIRRVTPDGVVTTFAGSPGNVGVVDGPPNVARFFNPRAISLDASGNLYVVEDSYTLRKVDVAGNVSTLAGRITDAGSEDGTGSQARFYAPQGVAASADGTTYVADTLNGTIRKATNTGMVTTFAGLAEASGSADGPGPEARFFHPTAAATDAAGNVFLADTSNDAIRRITPAGITTTVTTEAGDVAHLAGPEGIAVDGAGNLYVASTSNQYIAKITPNGVVSVLAGESNSFGSADGPGSTARFFYPHGLALDAGGNLYVADSSNGTIRRIAPDGTVSTFAGTAGSSGSADGIGAAARFYYPQALALDASGNLYVADTYNHTIRKITPGRVVTTLAGTAGSAGSADGQGAAARFASPQGVAVDARGNVFVADFGNSTVRRITPDGMVSTVGGMALSMGGVEGPGTTARFGNPSGLAFDASGNLFVVNNAFHSVSRGVPFEATVLSSFAAWQAAYFNAADRANPAVSSAAADGEGDGLGNLLEYAFALDPRVADSALAAPRAGSSRGFATLTFRRLPSRTDLNYIVEATDNLASSAWTEIARSMGGGNTAAAPKQNPSSINEAVAGSAVSVTVGDTIPIGSGVPHRFLRLRVVRP